MSLDINALLVESLSAEESDQTKVNILDAALDETAAQGLHGLTIEGVARRCRMNRATIYRQFGARDALQSAVMTREAQRLVQAMTEAVFPLGSPSDVFIDGFVTALRFAREHAVVQRLVAYEPGAMIEAASANDSALLKMGGTVMAQTVLWAQSQGFATHLNANVTGDLLARIFFSFVMLPGGDHGLNTDQKARIFAKNTLAPMLQGTANPPHISK